METKIRKIKKEDFSKLYSFWKAVDLWTYPFEEEKEKFERAFALNPSIMFVMLDDKSEIIDTIIGCFDGRSASVHRLAVSPDLQGKGYGKMLLKTLEARFKKQGIKKVALQVHISNLNVLEFYKKQGYIKDEVFTLKKIL